MAELLYLRLFAPAAAETGSGNHFGTTATVAPRTVRATEQRLQSSEPIFAVGQELTREDLLSSLQGRYNYASADCAARILTTNRGAKCPHAILQSQKDSYMLNLCKFDDKHVVIELCQDIRIDALVIANFEYFSSMVKNFRLFVSKKYPPPPSNGWREVGSFVAENSKQEQPFLVLGTPMYSRYVRLDFDTHYGNEYYCLLSKVRIYGKTMMEDFEESTLHGLPAPAKDIVIPIEAKVVPPPWPRSNIQKEESLEDGSSSSRTPTEPLTSVNLRGEPLPASFDLMELFRQHKEFCRATVTSSPTSVNDSASDYDVMHGVHNLGDNIFKAIYDRLYLLEKKMTKGTKALEGEFRDLTSKLDLIEKELGFIDDEADDGFSLPGGRSSRRAFRVRLLQHVNEKVDGYLTHARVEVQKILQSAHKTDRLLRWISLLASLQVLLIFGLVCWGWTTQGWFRRRKQRQYTRLGQNGTVAFVSPVLASRPITGALVRSTQTTPSQSMSSTSTEDSDQQVPGDEYRGASPAKSDLIDTAGKPLLLDESEPEIIDATYIPSPLSASSSITSMDLGSSGQNGMASSVNKPPSLLRNNGVACDAKEGATETSSSSSDSVAPESPINDGGKRKID